MADPILSNTSAAPQPTASVPYNQGQVNALPGYYTDTAQDFSGFVQDYLAKMNGPGGFTSGYTGNMVAGLDPYQTQAYNAGQTASGSQTPYVNSGANTMQTGQNWMTGANQYATTTPRNTFDSAGNIIGNEYGQIGNVDPYFQQGSGALGQASNYINNNAAYDPNAMQQHLSPYVGGVADEIARRSNENLFEQVLPNVNSTFTGAGQFGSTRNADFTQRAIRENQRTIAGAQSTALNQAYGQAADDYKGWAGLGQQAGGALTNVGQAYGGLGSQYLDRFVSGANMGTSLGNLGGQQSNYGTSLGGLGAAMSGLGNDYGNYGITNANQNWTDVNNMYGLGGQMQGYNQSVLDNAYQDWTKRWTQPAELAGSLAKMIPSYTDRLQPDQFGYNASVPESQNGMNDFLAFLSTLNSGG